MAFLNCHSITKLQVVASSAVPNDSPPSLSHHPQISKPNKLPKPNYEKLKQKQGPQPSILEIERAIGAGIFRNRDVNSGSEGGEKTNLFDNILRNSVGKNEGSVEKKLRETGEWLSDQAERSSGSAGKQILVAMFILVPLWISAFLVASGLLHLPFSTPFLDDLIA